MIQLKILNIASLVTRLSRALPQRVFIIVANNRWTAPYQIFNIPLSDTTLFAVYVTY